MPQKKGTDVVLEVKALQLQTMKLTIEGIAPYVQNRFAEKAREEIKKKQLAGDTAKARKKREPKDFQKCYEQAMHKSKEGWNGIPCSAFRNAMISACRAAGVVMTRAKLAVFIDPDGFDPRDSTPLTKITKGKPQYFETYARPESGGCDLRARPLWEPGWRAAVTITFDSSMIGAADVAELMKRAGRQVGIGEGRPDSRKSAGLGWGLFRLVNE